MNDTRQNGPQMVVPSGEEKINSDAPVLQQLVDSKQPVERKGSLPAVASICY